MKRRKKIEFTEWIAEQENVNNLVYFISGKDHWAKEFTRSVAEKFQVKHRVVNDNLYNDLKKIKYKPVGENKHVVLVDNHTGFKSKDLEDLVDYCRNPSKTSILIISVKTWKEKNKILKNIKEVIRYKNIKLIELEYPSREFIYSYIGYSTDKEGLSFDSKYTFEMFANNVGNETQKISEYLMKIKLFTDCIQKEHIEQFVDENINSTYDMLARHLVDVKKRNRKTVFKVFDNLVQSGKKESTIIINIRRRLELLYQAKLLKTQGILREKDFIEYKKRIYDKSDYKFSRVDIWKEPEYKINYWIRQSDKVSLGEIIFMLGIVDKEIDINNKKTFYKVDYKKSVEILEKIIDRRSKG